MTARILISRPRANWEKGGEGEKNESASEGIRRLSRPSKKKSEALFCTFEEKKIISLFKPKGRKYGISCKDFMSYRSNFVSLFSNLNEAKFQTVFSLRAGSVLR